ncbi:MAG: DUF932 domain-containing protein [Candidatus Methanoperedens sp.]|uniref:DUF932 domain-containing protein n=1 Tax=Candidatus Methanoperedens sp. BLZ2 TaxID=2035255 RepID=UPI000BE3F3F3|nr:DUF932 domain-containing protein [Candidatus Methanoperedens sp. BLZ2]KAB2946884.1 MAG: DUF945 domain-containing protein [Candidatus Methanoperedens sp.]MBZ0176675.1 DUF932 domain-containing protein [Candidatus Methanoperedens nitroreducens]MCX9080398.1 DUF932 domain-containing protein [Candidatus Methanoperedens sp.]
MEQILKPVFKENFVSRHELKIDQAGNLPLLANELKRQRDTKKDFIAPSQKIRVVPSPTDIILNIEDTGNYSITPQCHNQIAGKLEIPQGYYDRLRTSSPDLLSKNINHWLEKENPKLIRTLDGKARAFLSDRYKIIDNDDVFFMSVDEMGKGNMQFFRADLTENYLFLKAVSTTTQAEIRKGDVVQAGLIIRNSEIGLSRFQVEPFVLRLFCLNGMIVPDNGMKQTHIGRKMGEGIYSRETQELNALASLSAMRDIVRATINGQSFDNTVKLLIAASETEIIKPNQAINNISIHAGFTDIETENILYNFIHQNDPTKYGLLNAITSTAKNAETAERMTELETKANEVITLPDESFDEIINRKLRVKRAIAA